jgi:hypothetical protein
VTVGREDLNPARNIHHLVDAFPPGPQYHPRHEKEKGWRSEQATAAELVSVLYGPCADVKGVALDPLPLELSREMLPLVSMSRDLFLQYLLQERRGQQES